MPCHSTTPSSPPEDYQSLPFRDKALVSLGTCLDLACNEFFFFERGSSQHHCLVSNIYIKKRWGGGKKSKSMCKGLERGKDGHFAVIRYTT